MNFRTALLAVSILSFAFAGCTEDEAAAAPDSAAESSALTTMSAALQAELDALDMAVGSARQIVQDAGLDSADAVAALAPLLEAHASVLRACIVGPDGTLLGGTTKAGAGCPIGEPASAHPDKMESHRGVDHHLSEVHSEGEHPNVALLKQPIVSAGGNHLGSLSVLFDPYLLLEPVIRENTPGGDLHFVVGQTNGHLLHDPEPGKVHKNVKEHSDFADFAELQAVVVKVAAAQEGTTEFGYFDQQKQEQVLWRVYWNTIKLHGQQWRVVLQAR